MPILVPSPDAIIVDEFSSLLHPVASFILRRNSTNYPPTTNPHPRSSTNHDEPTADSLAPPARPPTQRRTQSHTPTNHNQSWAEVTKTTHPNPQHIPYSEGRGSSSKRRYRKRTTRRRALTTNTLSLSHSLSLSLTITPPSAGNNNLLNVREQHRATLRKFHEQHSNILLPAKKNTTARDKEEHNNIDDLIEHTLSEIKSLSMVFDNTASRIEHAWDTEPEIDITPALFYHEFILPTEATLQLALDDMDGYINNINTNNHNTITSSNNYYAQYQTNDDELSTTSDIAPNTDELEAIYQNNSPTSTKTGTAIEQPIDTKQKRTSLIELLLRYDTTTTAPRNNRRQNTLPILPPWNKATEIPTYQSRPQLTTIDCNGRPILPPRVKIPSRPDDTPPITWTFHPTTTLLANEHIEFDHGTDFHTHHCDIEINTPNNREHNTSFATEHATTLAITTTTSRNPAKPNRREKKPTFTEPQHQRRKTIIARKHDQNFVNKLVFITQNIRGLPIEDDTKLQSLVHQMKQHNWAAVCIQETWRLGEDDFYIDGYRIILKGNSTKVNDKGHVMGGVGIILSPEMDAAHKLASSKRTAFPNKHKYEGRFIGLQLHFNKRDSHGKKIRGILKTTLCSIYHPVDSNEHEEFNGITQTILNGAPNDMHFIFGQDINCNVGISDTNDQFRGTLGPNGINKRNNKGHKFLQHLSALNMKLANSFFTKENYTTWKNFKPSNPSFHMLDVFSISSPIFKHVVDCGTIPFGVDYTDHTATAITININFICIQAKKSNNNKLNTRADWQRIAYDSETKEEFNHKLSNELLHTNTTDDYTTFFDLVGKTAKETAIKPERPTNTWFEMSKEQIQTTIDRVTSLQCEIRDPSNNNPQATKRELQLAYRLRNIAVREAKSKYMSHIAQKISSLTGDNTRSMWEAINECKLGHENNYTRPQIMTLARPDGSRTTNDKENIEIMRPHCEKLFNNKKQVSADALDLIHTRPTETELDSHISWREFTKAISGLKNNKSPGANEIPAEAFKAMNNENKQRVFSFINSFWNDTADYPEWHAGQGIPVQKVTHPSNPNQYRIVNLMDVGSKIFSRILTARLYKLLDKHGTKYQFGATPNSGCQDANYTLKTLLHIRRQHNLETFVVFADLVKAFDTSDHSLIVDILHKYGAPPKICSAIRRLYTDLHVTLKIGKESTDIDQTVGVRQGDNLSPVVFLFVMTAFSEILDKKWQAAGLSRVEARHTELDQLATGQLTGHKAPTKKKGSTTHITQTLFLDDSGFPFNSREDAITGTKIIRSTFASLGLEMHCGNEENKKSKTEILWVPPPSFYANKTNSLPSAKQADIATIAEHDPTDPTRDTCQDFDESAHNNPTDLASLSITNARTRPLTFSTMTPEQREKLYWNSPNTNRIKLDQNGSFIDFTAHFKYLGSFISFDLTDDMDIKNRITKANQAMGALRHFWRNPYADLKAKKQVFLAIPANLLLWGCETWALRQSHIDKLNVFWHRAIRNILGIRMAEVIDDHITNEQIRKIFHDIPDAESLLNARSMNYLGKITRAPDTHPPKLLMTAWIPNPRPKAGVLSTNKKAMVRSLNALLPEETRETITKTCKTTGASTTTHKQNPNGDLKNWLHIALDKRLWDWHIYKLTHPNSPPPPRPSPAETRESNDPNNRQQHRQQQQQQQEQDPEQPQQQQQQQRQQEQQQQQQHNHNNPNNQHQRNQDNRQNRTNHQQRNTENEPKLNHTRTNYNILNVGRTRIDSIRAMGLHTNCTTTEIKHRFRILSLIYHPDKYDDSLGITKEEATAHFQTINNAYSLLRTT